MNIGDTKWVWAAPCVLLALVGFAVHERDVTERLGAVDAQAIDVACAAWEASGRQRPDVRGGDRRRLRILSVSAVDVSLACGLDYGERLDGCFIAPHHGEEPLIVVASDGGDRAATLVHETLHWVKWAATGSSDPHHIDSRLWGAVYASALKRHKGEGE